MKIEDPNLLHQWFKNGDHPEDNCQVFTEGPFRGSYKEGNVVRYFRDPGVDGDSICPLCNKTYHEHGWLDRRTPDVGETPTPPKPVDLSGEPQEPYGGPYYPGMVCPGDWILKTVARAGHERYTVKRVAQAAQLLHPHHTTRPATDEEVNDEKVRALHGVTLPENPDGIPGHPV